MYKSHLYVRFHQICYYKSLFFLGLSDRSSGSTVDAALWDGVGESYLSTKSLPMAEKLRDVENSPVVGERDARRDDEVIDLRHRIPSSRHPDDRRVCLATRIASACAERGEFVETLVVRTNAETGDREERGRNPRLLGSALRKHQGAPETRAGFVG